MFAFIDYEMNYEFISQVLCVNKDKPELQCNGKCHLVKEMAKTEKPENRGDRNNEVLRLSFHEIVTETKQYPIIGVRYIHQFIYGDGKVVLAQCVPPSPPPELA